MRNIINEIGKVAPGRYIAFLHIPHRKTRVASGANLERREFYDRKNPGKSEKLK
jgi:hypothetical protein